MRTPLRNTFASCTFLNKVFIEILRDWMTSLCKNDVNEGDAFMFIVQNHPRGTSCRNSSIDLIGYLSSVVFGSCSD